MKSNFETLIVWKRARDLRKSLSILCKKIPNNEKYRLCDQIIRASRSVTANIAEGTGRYHFQENIQFCRQARGSLYEILDHLTVCFDENYVREEEFNVLMARTTEVIRIMNGYLKHLNNKKNNIEKPS